jgi:hypothetical protein
MTLSLLVVATAALAGASCKKKAASGALDGGANASDASASVEGGAATASAATDATEAREPSLPAPVAPAARPVAPREPPPTPFTGSYRCFKGMQLEQAGDLVTSTMHTNGTTDTIVVCRVGGDVCTGTVREIQTTRGKPPKVMHVKPITLRRHANGDITYDVGAGEAKHGAGDRDHTFCPRR